MLSRTFAASVILATISTTGVAGPDRVSVLIGSKHTVSGEYEEVNPGLFLSWYNDRGNDWTAGVYRNSYGDVSVAVSRGWAIHPNWSIIAGLATYPDADQHFKYHVGNVVPVAGVRFQKGNVFIQAIPTVIAFGLTWEINQ